MKALVSTFVFCIKRCLSHLDSQCLGNTKECHLAFIVLVVSSRLHGVEPVLLLVLRLSFYEIRLGRIY